MRGDQYVGGVDFKFQFDDIRRALMSTTEYAYEMVLRRDFLERSGQQHWQGRYEPSFLRDDLLFDKSDLAASAVGEVKITVRREIDQLIRDEAGSLLAKGKAFTLHTHCEGEDFTVSFVPVKDAASRVAGYMVVYDDDQYVDQYHRISLQLQIAVAFSILMLCGFGGYRFYVAHSRERSARQLWLAHARLQQQLEENNLLQERLRDQAIHDQLTGAYNRHFMVETLRSELSRAQRDESAVSVVILDIDHFKNINDRFGHTVGDKVLRFLVECLRNQTRASDMICRFGGEEFVVIMPGTSLDAAFRRTDLWRQAAVQLSEELQSFEGLQLTFSAGIAIFPEDGLTDDELLSAADHALYEAKGAGRDRVMTSTECVLDKSAPQKPEDGEDA
jgi:diguanylate cyclase (GGDEF)-like protein